MIKIYYFQILYYKGSKFNSFIKLIVANISYLKYLAIFLKILTKTKCFALNYALRPTKLSIFNNQYNKKLEKILVNCLFACIVNENFQKKTLNTRCENVKTFALAKMLKYLNATRKKRKELN